MSSICKRVYYEFFLIFRNYEAMVQFVSSRPLICPTLLKLDQFDLSNILQKTTTIFSLFTKAKLRLKTGLENLILTEKFRDRDHFKNYSLNINLAKNRRLLITVFHQIRMSSGIVEIFVMSHSYKGNKKL